MDEGFRDGDCLIVEPRRTARAGQMVLAELDGGLTVKRFARDRSGRAQLLPANPELLPLARTGSATRIRGVVVRVLRRAEQPLTTDPPAGPTSDLERDLKTLWDAYAETAHPRLRRALLREALRIADQLHEPLPCRAP